MLSDADSVTHLREGAGPSTEPRELRAVVTVLGDDRPGIVAKVTAVLADAGANIEDISQTIRSGLFAMIMVVTLGADDTPFEAVRERLEKAGEDIGVQVRIQNEDIFRYMHRV